MHELAGAFALDALSDEERGFFTRHLDECAACRQEVDAPTSEPFFQGAL